MSARVTERAARVRGGGRAQSEQDIPRRCPLTHDGPEVGTPPWRPGMLALFRV
jgi:hypothetical protein